MKGFRRKSEFRTFLAILAASLFLMMACADVFEEINGLEELVGEEKSEEEEELSLLTDEEDGLLSGIFVDAVVGGVTFTGSGASGITDNNGTFYYRRGTTVTFTIGNINLGSATGQSQVTPLELAETTEVTSQKVVNIIRLLQTLDDDGNLDNGITITAAVRSAAANTSINFDQPTSDFETNTTAEIATLTSVRS